MTVFFDGPIVYINDDEDDHILFQQAMLELQFANSLRLFSNGADALAYLQTTTEQPLLILSDISMPLMDGLELRQQIMHYAVTYDVSRVTGIQQYVTLNPPSQSCQGCGNITDTIDFDIAETGWGGDGPSISLIDSPYDFKSFITYSSATWRGNTHTDSLEEDQ